MKKEKSEVLNHYKKLINEALNDLKTPGKRHKQIPNILTALRLFAPIVILPVAFTGNIPLTLGLAAGFALTDAADGFIARNWNLQSELGKDLDAIVDKVFATTLLAVASIANPLLLLNIGLEGVIALINTNKKLNGYEPSSTMTGKLKTWALFGLTILGIATPGLNEMGIINLLSVGTAGLQALTATSYLQQEKLKEEPNPTPPKDKSKVLKITDLDAKKETRKEKTKEIVIGQDNLNRQKSNQELLAELQELSQFFKESQNQEQVAIAGSQYTKK